MKQAGASLETETGVASRQQMQLPLSREERFELKRRFQSASIPVFSPLVQENLADLIWAIEMNTGQMDCRPSKQKLAAVLKIEVRTLDRWLDAGRGLFGRERVKREGRLVIEVTVNWDCVRWYGETRFVPAPPTAIGDTLFVHDRGEDGDTPFVHAPPGPEQLTGASSSMDSSTRRKNVVGPMTNVVGPTTNSAPRASARALVFSEGKDTIKSPFLGVLNKDPIRPPFLPHSLDTAAERARLPNAAKNVQGPTTNVQPREPPHVWLSANDLRDPALLMRWATMAIARDWKLDFETDFGFLLWVFTAASSAWRRDCRRGGHVEQPVPCFVALVKNRFKPDGRKAASNEDDEWARAALRDLERAAFNSNFHAGELNRGAGGVIPNQPDTEK